jgi:hypothetical protein
MDIYFLDHNIKPTYKMDYEPTIHSFYGVALPVTQNDIEFMERRNIKVQFLKRQLGEKYVLFNVTTIHNRGEKHGISK